MDLSTFQAVAVTLLAILPGAIYTWAYEQQTSASKAAVADRLIRLFGASTVFLVLALPGLPGPEELGG